ISEMIAKAKGGFHETGASAILWGSVVAICGLVNFAEEQWHFDIGFDIWMLTLAAFIPQAVILMRERKQKRVVTHMEAAMNAIWTVYAISIFALVFYFNTATYATDRLLATEGVKLMQTKNGVISEFHYFVPSQSSLFLILYAIPTLATGLARKFKAMTFGALLCYAFFIISCFTPSSFDMLLNGLAGIFNWLIPGLLLRNRFYQQKRGVHV
ncbi:MAG TPA: hypothetical protein VHK91_03065, partial [Flavisolibacter sp.]|nr:hypothetical protein [Flavisolibacter sp.]